MAQKRYELIIFEKFRNKGKTRYKPHRVGTALPFKDGFTLFIPPGVAITGRVLLVPEKTNLDAPDLMEAYQSAAEEYGL